MEGVTYMKKLIILLILLMTVLTACFSNKEEGLKETESVSKEKDVSEQIGVDKGLLNVEITLPATMFEGEDIDSVIADAEKDGIEVKQNEDGSITYRMSKSKHKEMLAEMEADLINTIEEVKNDEEYISIQDISYNKSFSEFTLEVDKSVYENSFDFFATFGLSFAGMYYQLFNGVDPDDYKVKINVKDVETQEVFDEVVYPEDLNEQGDQ